VTAINPQASAAGPTLPNSTNSSSSGPNRARKLHDKTISGVFTYTNGTDVETGLPDQRIYQLNILRSGNLSHSSLTNGIPNGSLKSGSGRERAHAKAASTHSVSASSARNSKSYTRRGQLGTSDGLTKLSNVVDASENGQPQLQPMRMTKSFKSVRVRAEEKVPSMIRSLYLLIPNAERFLGPGYRMRRILNVMLTNWYFHVRVGKSRNR
jgi:hypothetical protein